MPQAQPVARVDDPSREAFFNSFVRPGLPAVLTGTALSEAYAERWMPDVLAERLGAQTFSFKVSSSCVHPDFRAATLGQMFAREQLTFAEFFDRTLRGPADARSGTLFTGDEHFVARVRDGLLTINPELATLWSDIRLPLWVPQTALYSVWAWFSGQGVRTWLHYDNNGCHNLNLQVHGRKRCTLFSPAVANDLALFPIGGTNPATNCSQLDVEDPQVAVRLASLQRYETVLEQGELLFIPVNWLHTFKHLAHYNANVNFWWKPEHLADDPIAERERAAGSSSTGHTAANTALKGRYG